MNDGTAVDAGHVRIYEYKTVGIIENSFESKLQLYPNPTNGNFSVDLGSKYASVFITLKDINGKTIHSNTYHHSQLLNLEIDEPSGIYIMVIETESEKAILRLLKR